MEMTLFGPVPPESEAYVDRGLDDEIWRALARGEYVNLQGGRQTGKTSLLLRIRMSLAEDGAVSAYVDLSPLGELGFEESRWYQAFGEAVWTSLMPSDLQQSAPPGPSGTGDFLRYLYDTVRAVRPRRPLVILVDEVTAIPSPLQRPLLSTIRAMFNQRHDTGGPTEARDVLFVFAGSFNPERFIASQNSPFNVARTFDTSSYDFSPEQVSNLATRLGLDAIGDEVCRWTGGHPYLTNRLLELSSSSQPVDQSAQQLLSADSNLAHLARRLFEAGRAAVGSAMKIRAGEHIPYALGIDKDLDDLIVMGLIKSDQAGNAVIRCEIYSRFLDRLQQIRETPASEGVERRSPVDFLPVGVLREHAETLLEMAPRLADTSPALSAICVGVVLETALLLELEQRGDLSAAIQTLNQEVDAKRLDSRLRIRSEQRQPTDWNLAQMIEVARILDLVSGPASRVSHGLRDWRNLIHPARFRDIYPTGMPPEVADAAVANARLLLSELRSNRA